MSTLVFGATASDCSCLMSSLSGIEVATLISYLKDQSQIRPLSNINLAVPQK